MKRSRPTERFLAAIFGSSGIHGSHPSALHCSGQPPSQIGDGGMRRQRQRHRQWQRERRQIQRQRHRQRQTENEDKKLRQQQRERRQRQRQRQYSAIAQIEGGDNKICESRTRFHFWNLDHTHTGQFGNNGKVTIVDTTRSLEDESCNVRMFGFSLK